MRLRACALRVAFVGALACAPLSATADECFRWSERSVSLGGVLQLEVFPGPPNFDAIHRGDETVHEFVLELDRPLCVEAREEDAALADGRARSVAGQRRVQVLMDDARVEVIALGHLGSQVWLHGRFAPPASPYHYLPVLLQAKRISALPTP